MIYHIVKAHLIFPYGFESDSSIKANKICGIFTSKVEAENRLLDLKEQLRNDKLNLILYYLGVKARLDDSYDFHTTYVYDYEKFVNEMDVSFSIASYDTESKFAQYF